jgi:hypothetical protein
VPLRPNSSVRSAVQAAGRPPGPPDPPDNAAKATLPPNSPFQALRASIAPLPPAPPSISVTTNGAEAPREVPSTHSTYAVTARRRGRLSRLTIVRREIFTGSAGGTSCSSSSVTPCELCSKVLYPWPWRAV